MLLSYSSKVRHLVNHSIVYKMWNRMYHWTNNSRFSTEFFHLIRLTIGWHFIPETKQPINGVVNGGNALLEFARLMM